MVKSLLDEAYNPRTIYIHWIEIDSQVQIMKRIRFNFWIALAEIGGFRDGLVMLVHFITTTTMVTLFENDLISGGKVLPNPSP